jgi:glucoamylase
MKLAGSILLLIITASVHAQPAAVGRGRDARWESAGKQGVGTSNSLESKVWFTLQGGSLTEVFYPTADKANVQWLQFVVVDPKTKKIETERDDATHQIQTTDTASLSFRQVNKSKIGQWEIRKSYTTDPARNSVLIDVEFLPRAANPDLYLYYNPSLGNSGMDDSAWSENGMLLSNEGSVFSAVAVSGGFAEVSSGYFGANDGLANLQQSGRLDATATRAGNGNVAQIARIKTPRKFTLVLSFGPSAGEAVQAARASLDKGFNASRATYQQGWRSFARTLPEVGPKYQTQFNYAAFVLRASEDKTYRGGNVASLSKPWITGSAANTPNVGGYHLVWSRDLYHVATAYIAIGDRAAANRALDYLFTKQQKPDGSYPQISWLDGRTLGGSIQMDEVSYPLILAYQLGRTDNETFRAHIRPTADYIAKNGPKTQQERWEEKGGYSPATIAAEIAGLVCAAETARTNGDSESAEKWLATADEWERNIENWTATKTGKYRDGNYYLRITQNGKPDAGERIELNNNAGSAEEREIVDPSFLELVRLGIRSPEDPLINKSLKVVDDILKVNTPNGEAWFRYTRDGYGEMDDGRPWNWDLKYTGKGHLWALLAGERGQYEIARENFETQKRGDAERIPDSGFQTPGSSKARARLDAMLGFANGGLMIPEQIWDKPNSVFPFGEGTGSATPLAWSMAQFIRLAVNLKNGRNLDTPDVVAKRYAYRKR